MIMKTDLATLLSVVCVILFRPTSAISQCNETQKLRKDINKEDICCYTAKCNEGERFDLCTYNGGTDACYPCEGDYTTGMVIDTKFVNVQFNPCIHHQCPDGSVLRNKSCVCDTSIDFYGNDSSNCISKTCQIGFKLTINGTCETCNKDDNTKGCLLSTRNSSVIIAVVVSLFVLIAILVAVLITYRCKVKTVKDYSFNGNRNSDTYSEYEEIDNYLDASYKIQDTSSEFRRPSSPLLQNIYNISTSANHVEKENLQQATPLPPRSDSYDEEDNLVQDAYDDWSALSYPNQFNIPDHGPANSFIIEDDSEDNLQQVYGWSEDSYPNQFNIPHHEPANSFNIEDDSEDNLQQVYGWSEDSYPNQFNIPHHEPANSFNIEEGQYFSTMFKPTPSNLNKKTEINISGQNTHALLTDYSEKTTYTKDETAAGSRQESCITNNKDSYLKNDTEEMVFKREDRHKNGSISYIHDKGTPNYNNPTLQQDIHDYEKDKRKERDIEREDSAVRHDSGLIPNKMGGEKSRNNDRSLLKKIHGYEEQDESNNASKKPDAKRQHNVETQSQPLVEKSLPVNTEKQKQLIEIDTSNRKCGAKARNTEESTSLKGQDESNNASKKPDAKRQHNVETQSQQLVEKSLPVNTEKQKQLKEIDTSNRKCGAKARNIEEPTSLKVQAESNNSSKNPDPKKHHNVETQSQPLVEKSLPVNTDKHKQLIEIDTSNRKCGAKARNTEESTSLKETCAGVIADDGIRTVNEDTVTLSNEHEIQKDQIKETDNAPSACFISPKSLETDNCAESHGTYKELEDHRTVNEDTVTLSNENEVLKDQIKETENVRTLQAPSACFISPKSLETDNCAESHGTNKVIRTVNEDTVTLSNENEIHRDLIKETDNQKEPIEEILQIIRILKEENISLKNEKDRLKDKIKETEDINRILKNDNVTMKNLVEEREKEKRAMQNKIDELETKLKAEMHKEKKRQRQLQKDLLQKARNILKEETALTPNDCQPENKSEPTIEKPVYYDQQRLSEEAVE